MGFSPGQICFSHFTQLEWNVNNCIVKLIQTLKITKTIILFTMTKFYISSNNKLILNLERNFLEVGNQRINIWVMFTHRLAQMMKSMCNTSKLKYPGVKGRKYLCAFNHVRSSIIKQKKNVVVHDTIWPNILYSRIKCLSNCGTVDAQITKMLLYS